MLSFFFILQIAHQRRLRCLARTRSRSRSQEVNQAVKLKSNVTYFRDHIFALTA